VHVLDAVIAVECHQELALLHLIGGVPIIEDVIPVRRIHALAEMRHADQRIDL
jgi:hypothetical protein